ncbi:hypothetical protein ES703_16998 [subsurface metagenome]
MEWATKDGFFKAKVPQEQMTTELGTIWVKGLKCGEKDEYENAVIHFKAKSRQVLLANARAKLLQITVYDQHGKLMFDDTEMGKLCEVPAIIADPILDVARRLSGMTTGEIEDLVKNSETAQKKDSNTG